MPDIKVSFIVFENATQAYIDDMAEILKEKVPKDFQLILLPYKITTITKAELEAMIK